MRIYLGERICPDNMPFMQCRKPIYSALLKMQQLNVKRWKCKICGYIHEGENPPENCPVCGASKEDFEEYDY